MASRSQFIINIIIIITIIVGNDYNLFFASTILISYSIITVTRIIIKKKLLHSLGIHTGVS
jgi:hypothetical protein